MKVYELKKDSWHYRIASWSGGVYRINDICSYIRAFTFNLSILLIIGGLIAAMGAAVIWSIINAIGLMFGMKWSLFSSYGMSLLIIGCMMYISMKVYDYMNNNKTKENKAPGFVKIAYNKFKDKTCSRITFI